jgi:environmental stress-induced protein Ves
LKMVIRYRAEKKKLLLNHLRICEFADEVLIDSANFSGEWSEFDTWYRERLWKEEPWETNEFNKIKYSGGCLKRWKKDFYWRRLVNAQYFRLLKQILKDTV